MFWEQVSETDTMLARMAKKFTEAQEAYADWLLSDPREPSTQAEFAKLHKVSERSLSRWKKDPDFNVLWDMKAREKNISVDRVQSVIDALWIKATKHNDVKAAALYLQYVERFTPTHRLVVDESRSVKAMTDEDIESELRALLGTMEYEDG